MALHPKSGPRLATVHPDLAKICELAAQTVDMEVLEGHRGRAAQEHDVAIGTSTLHYPHGDHNQWPSIAVDVVPTPCDWNDTDGFNQVHLAMQTAAEYYGIVLRWGGDWHKPHDMPHHELLTPRALAAQEMVAFGSDPDWENPSV